MENAGSRALVRGMETNSLSLHKQQKKAKRRFCLFPLTAPCAARGKVNARDFIICVPLKYRAHEENPADSACASRGVVFKIGRFCFVTAKGSCGVLVFAIASK